MIYGIPSINEFPINNRDDVINYIGRFNNVKEIYKEELSTILYKEALKYKVMIPEDSQIWRFVSIKEETMNKANIFELKYFYVSQNDEHDEEFEDIEMMSDSIRHAIMKSNGYKSIIKYNPPSKDMEGHAFNAYLYTCIKIVNNEHDKDLYKLIKVASINVVVNNMRDIIYDIIAVYDFDIEEVRQSIEMEENKSTSGILVDEDNLDIYYLGEDSSLNKKDLKDSDYGIPEIKKFPIPDKKHVLLAIKFFNTYVGTKWEKELANNINKKIIEFKILDSEIHMTKVNQFKKYYKPYNPEVKNESLFRKKNNFIEPKISLEYAGEKSISLLKDILNDKSYSNNFKKAIKLQYKTEEDEEFKEYQCIVGSYDLFKFSNTPRRDDIYDEWCKNENRLLNEVNNTMKPLGYTIYFDGDWNGGLICCCMSNKLSLLNEGYVLNDKDIYYNKNKFDSGEINLCFITGQSGSGKSTMANNMVSDKKIESYELDDVIWNKVCFTMENFKEYGDLIYSFFKGPGKKYYCTVEECRDGRFKGINYEKCLITDFVKYSINYAKSHKDTKFVLNGVWLYMFIKPSELKDYAVYIKGTSTVISRIRGAKRDCKDAKGKFGQIKAFCKNISNLKKWKNFFVDEKSIKEYRDFFSKLMIKKESYSIDKTNWKLVKTKDAYMIKIKDQIISKLNYYDYNIENFDWILIANIETNKNYRRCGFATELINAIYSDISKTNKGIYLFVKIDNTEAINLYKKLGFKKIRDYKLNSGRYYIMVKGNADTNQFLNMNFNESLILDKLMINNESVKKITDLTKELNYFYCCMDKFALKEVVGEVDEDMSYKDLDSAIKNCYTLRDFIRHNEGKYDSKNPLKALLKVYNLCEVKDDEGNKGYKPLYIGKVLVYIYDKDKIDWEWDEQETIGIDKDTNEIVKLKEEYLIDKDKYPKYIYHLSDKNHDGEIFNPKTFDIDDEWERKIPRICFSDSINGALNAIVSQGYYDGYMYVHVPDGDFSIYGTTERDVFDSPLTHEMWIKEPVKMKCIGKIYIYDVANNKDTLLLNGRTNFRKIKYFGFKWKWVAKYYNDKILYEDSNDIIDGKILNEDSSEKSIPEVIYGSIRASIKLDMKTKEFIIKGIDYNKFFLRLREMYNHRGISNLFDKNYTWWSMILYKKEKIVKNKMKVTDIRCNLFFALEIYKMFLDLADEYGLKYYNKVANNIYNKTWISNFESRETKDIDLTNLNKFRYTLKKHQLDYVKEYNTLKFKYDLEGYVLSLDQGLGKTFTAIALAECLNKNQIIIVCPNTLKENWANEIKDYYKEYYDNSEKFYNDVYVSNNPRYKYTNTNKFLIVNQESIDKIYKYVDSSKNSMIIVDECHNFRNNSSDRTIKLLKLKEIANCKDNLPMSGTPIKATPDELIPVLRLIDPYFTKELADTYRKAFNSNSTEISRVVKERFDRVIYRKTKKDVLSLPEKHISDLFFTIKNEKEYYIKEINSRIAELFDKYYAEEIKKIPDLEEEFSKLIKEYSLVSKKETDEYLRFISNQVNEKGNSNIHEHRLEVYNEFLEKNVYSNPKLTSSDRKRIEELVKSYVHIRNVALGKAMGEILPKARANCYIDIFNQNSNNIIKRIKENSKKTVIFTAFLPVVQAISETLEKNDIGHVKIIGSTNKNTRMDLINQFRYDDSIDVLIATTQTMSTGVTLTEANQMFFFGTPYRSADFEQACDRIHRIGQTSEVFIYKVLLRSSEKNITERIDEILGWSSDMFNSIINEDSKAEICDKVVQLFKDNGFEPNVSKKSYNSFIDGTLKEFNGKLCIAGLGNDYNMISKTCTLINKEIKPLGAKVSPDNYGTAFLSIKEDNLLIDESSTAGIACAPVVNKDEIDLEDMELDLIDMETDDDIMDYDLLMESFKGKAINVEELDSYYVSNTENMGTDIKKIINEIEQNAREFKPTIEEAILSNETIRTLYLKLDLAKRTNMGLTSFELLPNQPYDKKVALSVYSLLNGKVICAGLIVLYVDTNTCNFRYEWIYQAILHESTYIQDNKNNLKILEEYYDDGYNVFGKNKDNMIIDKTELNRYFVSNTKWIDSGVVKKSEFSNTLDKAIENYITSIRKSFPNDIEFSDILMNQPIYAFTYGPHNITEEDRINPLYIGELKLKFDGLGKFKYVEFKETDNPKDVNNLRVLVNKDGDYEVTGFLTNMGVYNDTLLSEGGIFSAQSGLYGYKRIVCNEKIFERYSEELYKNGLIKGFKFNKTLMDCILFIDKYNSIQMGFITQVRRIKNKKHCNVLTYLYAKDVIIEERGAVEPYLKLINIAQNRYNVECILIDPRNRELINKLIEDKNNYGYTKDEKEGSKLLLIRNDLLKEQYDINMSHHVKNRLTFDDNESYSLDKFGSNTGRYNYFGLWNPIVYLDGKPYRERGEILIFNKDKDVYMSVNMNKCKIPGGGSMPNITIEEQAIRECQEEARINVTNVKYIGCYKNVYNDAHKASYQHDKEIEHVEYEGAITYLFVADYAGKYTGEIDYKDRDSIIKEGKFHPIKNIIDICKKEWVVGIYMYMSIENAYWSERLNNLSIDTNFLELNLSRDDNSNIRIYTDKKEYTLNEDTNMDKMKLKRAKMEKLLYGFCNIIDKTGKNAEKYRNMYGSLSDEDFFKAFKKFFNSDKQFYFEFLPNLNEPNLKQIREAADFMDYELNRYVYYRHDGDGNEPVRTRYKVPIGVMPVKRLQQVLSKKNTYSFDISSRNSKTGSLTGHDRIARITDMETYQLVAKGANYALQEFLGPRGDNMSNKMEMYRQISNYGYVYLKDLPNDTKGTALTTIADFFKAGGLKTDL